MDDPAEECPLPSLLPSRESGLAGGDGGGDDAVEEGKDDDMEATDDKAARRFFCTLDGVLKHTTQILSKIYFTKVSL